MEQSIHIDFIITSNPYYLTVTDTSNWALIENKPSIIEITLPGSATPETRYFDQYAVNNFNSNDLNITCPTECDQERVTLPDGIYKVKLIGSPSNFCKQYYYLKTDMFDMELDKLYIKYVNRRDRKAVMDQIADIELLVRGASANIKYENINIANEMFSKAAEIVDKLLNCPDCVRM